MGGWFGGRDWTPLLPGGRKRTLVEYAESLPVDIDGGDGGGSWRGNEGEGG